ALFGGVHMWFRNLQFYRLGQDFDLSPEALDKCLRAQEFRGCNSMDMVVSGWVPPLGRHGQQLVHAINGYYMICLRKAEKIIPAGVVKQLLDDKVAEVEASELREVYRREKMRMKEDIIVNLLPRALVRLTDLYAYIDIRNQLIVVDSPTPARAEALISQIRTTLGSFPATPVKARHSVSNIMTRWINGERMPPDFSLGEECELKHPDPEGGVVNCKGQELAAGEIRNHVKHGKYAVKLAIQWKQRLSCVLQEDLSVKRLRFEDVIKEAEGDSQADDPASRFDLDFSLMTLELAEFLPQLLSALGGEDLPGQEEERSAA
ncbi:MAG: recombination-associated protein RdgC, partial [Pseudomonadota bacterium]|nr:recombination-associated protein RdgC [Pseudomonadota bacterium]